MTLQTDDAREQWRVAKIRAQRFLKEWDEGKHPRVPAGGPDGGQFGAGGGGETGEASPSSPVDPGKDSKLLSADEQKSILYYQGQEGFSKINNSLRAGKPPGEHAKRLSSAIAKHRLMEDVTVFRGVGNTLSKQLSDLWRDKEPGDDPIVFEDRAFVSTSMSQKIAETFSKNTIKIKVPKGHNALPIVDREHAHEAEILIDKGTRFKVLSMRKTASGYRRFEVEIVQ